MSTWQGNTQIKVSSSNIPLTSHGPALAVLGTRLIMVYVGRHGANLWFSYLNNGSNNFTEWQGNEQIKIGRDNTPQASYRPALAVIDGTLHMVYTGTGGVNLWWSWYDGQNWSGNLELNAPGSVLAGDQPALGIVNGELCLIYHQYVPPVLQPSDPANPNSPLVQVYPGQNLIFYSTWNPKQPFEARSWAPPKPLGTGVTLPALGALNGAPWLFASFGEEIGFQHFAGQPANWQILQTGNTTPESSGGVAVSARDSNFSLVYPGKGGKNLWTAGLTDAGIGSGNTQIKTGSTTPETSAPPALTIYENVFCLAYKGESSNDLWFSFAS